MLSAAAQLEKLETFAGDFYSRGVEDDTGNMITDIFVAPVPHGQGVIFWFVVRGEHGGELLFHPNAVKGVQLS